MFKIYDLKNRKKIVVIGTAKHCAEVIGCHWTYVIKAASKELVIFGRYKVVKR